MVWGRYDKAKKTKIFRFVPYLTLDIELKAPDSFMKNTSASFETLKAYITVQ